MKKLFYISEGEVQSQQATKCNLLVHIGLETIQYAVSDRVRDQLKVLAEFELPATRSSADLIRAIESLPESTGLFKYNFNRIKISLDTFSYTFIPAELFSEQDMQGYAKFISPEPGDSLLIDHITPADIKNITAIKPELNDALNRIFHKPLLFNQASAFLQGIQKTAGPLNQASLFVNIGIRHIEMACFNDSLLRFYNIFECTDADEFNYFLLSVIRDTGINGEECIVFLSGKVSEEHEYVQRIRKYIRQITFADSKQIIAHPEKFGEHAPHTYFSLISLDLCG
jgi:hypothetical protein